MEIRLKVSITKVKLRYYESPYKHTKEVAGWEEEGDRCGVVGCLYFGFAVARGVAQSPVGDETSPTRQQHYAAIWRQRWKRAQVTLLHTRSWLID